MSIKRSVVRIKYLIQIFNNDKEYLNRTLLNLKQTLRWQLAGPKDSEFRQVGI
jgi:hypothetical protein